MSNPYTPRRTSWDPTWNGWEMGTNMSATPDLKITLKPIKRGQTGDLILGHWITGMEGMISIECADMTRLLQEKMFPWFAGSAGVDSIPLLPSGLNVNLYSYAQELILHPHDGADAKQDLHLIKAVPVSAVKLPKRDGIKDDLYNIDFYVYPDVSRIQASPPEVIYGYVGDTAI